MNIEINEEMKIQDIYDKELTTKKNILECISVIKDNKDNLTSNKLQEFYTTIYKNIEGMGKSVKPNTIMYLKNQLKAQLGKFVEEKDPKGINHFIEYFKQAYPAGKRSKGFTRVLMDISKITEEQIWDTLTYINAWCLKDKLNRLRREEKEDIIEMVEVLVKRNKIKYINQLKSLEKLQDILKIKVVSANEKFKIKRIEN